MSISIIVERAPADSQGGIISDPLISTVAQAMERGRREIDKNSTDRVIVSGTCPLQPWMQCGKLVQVTDLDGDQSVAMLKSFALTISRQSGGSFTATTSISMERE